MTVWAVSVTDTFLNELLNLPHAISKKVAGKIKILEKDPISAQGDAKKLKGYKQNVYRVRLGDYRLFYSFGDGWIKLLSIRKRDDRTYETEVPAFDLPIVSPRAIENWEDSTASNSIPTSSPIASRPLPFILTQEQLQQWQIPQQHWDDLCQVKTEDDLIALAIPDKILSRILDNLFPRPIEEIENQPEYLLAQPEDLDRFFNGDISAFLLKLDPEQEKLLSFGSKGSTLVKGGPGTGKSTLALYRVKTLLEWGVKPILFTTYTKALVTYSQQLLEQLLGNSPEAMGVTVTTVDSLVYKNYGKTGFASEEQCLDCLAIALKTAELPARNVFDRQVRRQSLEKLGLTYLLQEILEIIESRGLNSLEDYQNTSRNGRGIPLKANLREAIWAVYQTWTDLMEKNGTLTWEQLRRKALAVVSRSDFTPPYQAVIVDEAQDLSPVALRFLLSLIPSVDSVYLTADASQSLYQKGFSWKQIHADLKVAGRTLLLKRNYRNTQQISAACAQILAGTEAGDEDCIRQYPSPHHGDLPLVWQGEDEREEILRIRDFFITCAKKYRLPLHGSAILCPSIQGAKQYAQRLDQLGLKAKFVGSKEIDLRAPYIKTMTLHSAKGLEFPFVVVGLSESTFPQIEENLPPQEIAIALNAQRRLFYVGCSRAMRALMVSGTKTSCQFLEHLDENYWQLARTKGDRK
ncbi:hypothetical protein NIES593_15000 [Hydrococcus rivularis NIES-593]|uniref:DNA 3'-5' helicase n=1 Tax=Hydrococcus rivularis NIES-593 TaxID=1921803 RepID=A0A1U7HDT4_9CYAN|nr:3'-5' exonuclease [Hydrococcus rivularis]OKH21729.1 hypothetical protein NIES593_15000 [Hydrococcus rivularis NIES-593]